MKLVVLSFIITMSTMVHSQTTQPAPVGPVICPPCPAGRRGSQGTPGERGQSGDTGAPGKPGLLSYLGLPSQCPSKCPPGVQGSPGLPGIQGEIGEIGKPGIKGKKGIMGDRGVPGQRGLPGPSNDSILYLPYKPGKTVDHVCFSFRRFCYVPGLKNGWRAWHREGQSGFMVYKKWLYYITLSECPCKFERPAPPQPVKPSECLSGSC